MRPVVVGSSPKKGMDGASNLDGFLWASPMNITYVPLDTPGLGMCLLEVSLR